ncbi:DUF4197 domain-containing protein [Inhella sp.]|uniref:DUF4197 domain-containing protein n=1 Tax=Inhella sp. TaxID=1921806 RepID=UPI0035B294A8
MKRRHCLLLLAPLPAHAALLESDAAQGVRAALERGALAAVSQLGRVDGFFAHPELKIELPGALKDAAKLLKATGQGKKVDALVLAMNRAAEAAVPQARDLLVQTVKKISVEDALRLVRASEDDAVTRFFETKTREPLTERFLPIVTKATEKQSLADKYNAVAGKAAGLGLLKGEDSNIQSYVTRKALDGLYRLIGEEEKKIRQDPVGTGSAILKKVFKLG